MLALADTKTGLLSLLASSQQRGLRGAKESQGEQPFSKAQERPASQRV